MCFRELCKVLILESVFYWNWWREYFLQLTYCPVTVWKILTCCPQSSMVSVKTGIYGNAWNMFLKSNWYYLSDITYLNWFFPFFSATAPGALPPCFNPPPPPPPIEDIPHQTTVPQRLNRCMGPAYRGTYSDAEMCHCRGHYMDSNTALLHNHHSMRGHYSDNENPYHRGHSCSDSEHYHQVRQCVYSGEESDFEPHYLEQTASGNVLIPGQSISVTFKI